MGTRADFYVKEERELKQEDWLGSIAWDGYPSGIPNSIKKAKTVKAYIKAVREFLLGRDDATFPTNGWPWPWETSATTDLTYIFFKKSRKVSWRWFDKKTKFPDMTNIKNLAMGDRSGLIVVTAQGVI